MDRTWLLCGFCVVLTVLGCGEEEGEPEGSGGASADGGSSGSGPGSASGGAVESGGSTNSGGSDGGAATGGSPQKGEGGMAGSSSSGAAGAAGAPAAPGAPDTVSVFVAQGHVGRTVLSCDGGRTWVAEHSTVGEVEGVPQQNLQCWRDNVDPDGTPFELDCDHYADPGRGIAFADGMFLATFGWGDPGRVVSSVDGVNWEVVLQDTTFGGVAPAQGAWILGARYAQRSTDGGTSFEEAMDTGLEGWNVRRVGSTTGFGERVILVGEAGDAVVTSDGGQSWWTPSEFPAGCGASIQTEGGIVSNGELWLVIGGDGSVCVTGDGGETWEESSVGADVSSHAVFNGTTFQVWSRGTLHSSEDGLNWQSTPTIPPDISIGPVAADAEGRLAAVRGGWDVWYEDQRFYTSGDGVTWAEAEEYWGGHPIRSITSGEILRPEVCQ